jgi:hypothetical protein
MNEQSADRLDEYIPESGWLYDYIHFTSTLEACTRFRFFSACVVLGAAVNNQVWISRGDPNLLPKLFPNPWVLLLAPPGRGHKTSTINMAVNCLYQASPEVRLIADKLTPESLVKSLSIPSTKEIIRIGPRDATGLIKAPELSVFFGKQQYNTGLVSLITDLYDYREEWTSETIMRGKNILRNNCLSIIGGSTPAWLQRMLPEDAFTGGFMSRFIIVEMPPEYFKRKPFPKGVGDVEWSQLVQGLRKLCRTQGEFEWSKGSVKAYEEFYCNLKPTGDPQRDAYQEREAEQVIKIAMLLALSEETLILKKKHMDGAAALLKCLLLETEPRIERLSTHPRMVLVQEIQDLLRARGGLTRRELLHHLYRGLSYGEQQFTEAMRVLSQAGVMDGKGEGGGMKYYLVEEEKK